ncbi:RagB/SusD family nutrient uptake outer membrane protein [Wenyingzhuangia sp. 1_MG-2023]|nr:RagB/SusD family nutrient uptake outer membrane protein [Wenyingzhuangia sp. 1_MG-2023]
MKVYYIVKKTIGKCFLTFLLISTLTSCFDDYLAVDVYESPVSSSFYKTEIDAEQALTAAYAPMNSMYGVFFKAISGDLLFGDIGTDDLLKGGANISDRVQLYEKETYNLTTSNASVKQIWKENYIGVLYANLVLEKVPNINFADATYKKQIIAEAHFLRAYYYFYLLNSFGGVPLIKEGVFYGDTNIPRATEIETYEFIEDDLKAAIADLPSRFTQGDDYLGHADKGAALGLMMRVSLYQNKMGQVKTYGDQLLTLPYVLEPDFNNVFQQSGEWNSGSVFEIDFSSNSSGLGNQIPLAMTPKSKGGIGLGQLKQELIDAYDVNDPRITGSFYQVTGGYGTTWYNKKYSWSPYSDYNQPTIGGKGNSANNIRVIRLADAYLMYAEAIYQTNPITAIEYVNKVRKRARESGGIGNLVPADLPLTLIGDDLRDAIYKERRLELAGEGFRYHDLIRTNRAADVLVPLGYQVGKNEVMPIPYEEITLSQGIILQNNY